MVKGRLAIVTGGGSGIGQATCQMLSRDGARVVVTDINENAAKATLKTLSGIGHCYIKLDVTNEENVQNVFKFIIDNYNAPPTIVINCAGILHYLSSFLDETVGTMQLHLDVNFKGTFLVTQTACRMLTNSKLCGSIVNVSSFATIDYPACVSYESSKAAVICLTKAVAREMAQFGIRCNMICPGGSIDKLRPTLIKTIETSMNNGTYKHSETTKDVAELIVFFASERNSSMNASVTCIP